jgi:hypothetical protein
MSDERTLREAIAAWMDQLRSTKAGDLPFTPAELYDFLLQPQTHPRGAEIRAALLQHPQLAVLLAELAASRKEAETRLGTWDMALPKAAAVAGEGTGRITTEGGKYTIEIRPHLDKVNHGLVVVRVAVPYRDRLEGTMLELQDSSGQLLVRGRVVDGEVSGELENLTQIDYGFVVRTARAQG